MCDGCVRACRSAGSHGKQGPFYCIVANCDRYQPGVLCRSGRASQQRHLRSVSQRCCQRLQVIVRTHTDGQNEGRMRQPRDLTGAGRTPGILWHCRTSRCRRRFSPGTSPRWSSRGSAWSSAAASAGCDNRQSRRAWLRGWRGQKAPNRCGQSPPRPTPTPPCPALPCPALFCLS